MQIQTTQEHAHVRTHTLQQVLYSFQLSLPLPPTSRPSHFLTLWMG